MHPALAELAESLVTGASTGSGKSRQVSSKCSRIVLPYHPGLRRVNALLAGTYEEFSSHGWSHVIPKVCWSLGGRNIQRLMQADGKLKLQ